MPINSVPGQGWLRLSTWDQYTDPSRNWNPVIAEDELPEVERFGNEGKIILGWGGRDGQGKERDFQNPTFSWSNMEALNSVPAQ